MVLSPATYLDEIKLFLVETFIQKSYIDRFKDLKKIYFSGGLFSPKILVNLARWILEKATIFKHRVLFRLKKAEGLV